MLAVLAVLALSGIAHAQTCAVPGRNGATGTSGTVNTYFQPNAGTYDASSTAITLSGKTGTTTALTEGDLVLVIQMQCATLDTTNTSNYGAGAGTGRGYTEPGTCAAGQHQYVRAGAGSSDTTLNLRLDGSTNQLNATYIQDATTATNRRTFQVIRVPQNSSLTLGGTVTAAYWNGNTGGVVALDVTGQLNWNGAGIDVTGRGFRGAGSINWGAGTDVNVPPDYLETIANNRHATKAEGIGGTPRYTFDPQTNTRTDNGATWGGYASGDDGRGAPATAGGGGNNRNGTRDNGGGGGGGNGGIGGYGGYGWKSGGWAGTFTVADFDMRGIGGDAFGSPSVSRVVMGGGGGAGGTNNSGDPTTFGGGAGGGLVMVRAGSMTGSGTINARGLAGITNNNNDGASGGGAGGSVIVVSQTGNVGTLAINGQGGVGADSYPLGTPAHGGGGGGAGGVVIHNGAPTVSVTGAANGVTNLGENPVLGAAHGATPGAAGIDSTGTGDPPGVRNGALCLPNLTVTKTSLTPTITTAAATSASYTIVVSNSGGAAMGASLVDNTLPPGWTFSRSTGITFSPSLSATVYGGFVEGATVGLPAVAGSPGGTVNFTINGAPAAAPVWRRVAIPAQVNGSPGLATLSYVVSIPATATVGCYHNPGGVNFYDPTRSSTDRTVTMATNNTANRAGAQAGGTVTSVYQTDPGPGTTVGGSHHSGLEGGPATENVCLFGDFSVTKSAPASATAGATLTYTLTPRNNGRAIADLNYATHQATTLTGTGALAFSTVRVIDTLPAGVTLTAGPSPVNWSCGTLGQTVTCDRSAPVAPMAAATNLNSITLTARVTSGACAGPATNTATVSGFNAPLADSAPANNTGTAATTLNCDAFLQVTKTNNVGTVTSGGTTSYTVTFSNLGPSSADNATVTDVASAGLSGCAVASCSASGGTPVASCPVTPANLLAPGGTTLPSLPSGGVVQFIVNCNVTASGS